MRRRTDERCRHEEYDIERMMAARLACLVFVVAVAGCASSSTGVEQRSAGDVPPDAPLVVPAGVDSAVAAYADSLAEASFVPIDVQERAFGLAREAMALKQRSDSMWQYLEVHSDSLSAADVDSAEAIRAFNRGAIAFRERAELAERGDLDSLAVAQRQAELLDSSQTALEESIRLDPFDDETRNLLAVVYSLQAQRLQRTEAYERSIEVLERLVRLRPGEHSVYALLGDNYYRIEEWDRAADRFGRAAEVYLDTYDLTVASDAPELDSATVFLLKTREADAFVYARRSGPARSAYRAALEFATAPADRRLVRDEIAWIDWDGGNVANSFARDSLAGLAAAEDLEAAARGFRELRPRLDTARARDEINWRLAMVQYRMGSRYRAAALLQEIYDRMDGEDVPIDSTNQRYVDAYGTVTFNLGMEYLAERRDNRTALKYLEQSARIPWENRPMAQLEAAKLLKNRPDASLRYAHEALEADDRLDDDDRFELYVHLLDVYRRLGNREEALKFRDMARSLQSRR